MPGPSDFADRRSPGPLGAMLIMASLAVLLLGGIGGAARCVWLAAAWVWQILGW